MNSRFQESQCAIEELEGKFKAGEIKDPKAITSILKKYVSQTAAIS